MQKVNTIVSVINKDPTNNSQLASNELAPPNHTIPLMSSHTLCSNPVSHSHSVITTSKDFEAFRYDEPYNPVSYVRDIRKVSIFPSKSVHAYNILQAVPFENGLYPPLVAFVNRTFDAKITYRNWNV